MEAEHLLAKEDMRMNVTQKWFVPCLSWQLSMGWMATDLVIFPVFLHPTWSEQMSNWLGLVRTFSPDGGSHGS